MRLARLILLIVFGSSLFALTSIPASADESKTDRKYLLERVDDIAVVQLYADGFKDLPLKQKMLIWHLYQASIAGRDIYYDQRCRDRHQHARRYTLKLILTHPEGIDPATLAEIRHYAKLFWINSGPYNHLTARKFFPKFTPEVVREGSCWPWENSGRSRTVVDIAGRIRRRTRLIASSNGSIHMMLF